MKEDTSSLLEILPTLPSAHLDSRGRTLARKFLLDGLRRHVWKNNAARPASSPPEGTAHQVDASVDITQQHDFAGSVHGYTRSYKHPGSRPSPELELHGMSSQVHFAQGQCLALDDLLLDEKRTPLQHLDHKPPHRAAPVDRKLVSATISIIRLEFRARVYPRRLTIFHADIGCYRPHQFQTTTFAPTAPTEYQ